LLSEDEYLVRLSRADRIRLTRLFLRQCRRPLLAATLGAIVIWAALVPALWSLMGLQFKALGGHGAALAALGSVSSFSVRLAFFFLLSGTVSSIILLSLNNLIDRCQEGDTPDGWEEAVMMLLAPWHRWRLLWAPLAVWLGLAAIYGAALALASLPPYLGVLLALAGTAVFALLYNCVMWHLIHLEHEEPGLEAAVTLPFLVLGHSDILWRKTLTLGLAVCLPGLVMMAVALSPLWTGFFWSGLVFLSGMALLTPGLTFFGCYFALAYKQALANHRLRCQRLEPGETRPAGTNPAETSDLKN
jgi:hypothetical protein